MNSRAFRNYDQTLAQMPDVHAIEYDPDGFQILKHIKNHSGQEILVLLKFGKEKQVILGFRKKTETDGREVCINYEYKTERKGWEMIDGTIWEGDKADTRYDIAVPSEPNKVSSTGEGSKCYLRDKQLVIDTPSEPMAVIFPTLVPVGEREHVMDFFERHAH